MNQQQRKYATERIESIAEAKIKAIKEANTTKSVELNRDQKIEAIRTGKAPLRANPDMGYCHFASNFDFSKLEKPSVYNKTKAEPLIKKIQDAAQKAKDEINLGDSETALKAVAAFEKLK